MRRRLLAAVLVFYAALVVVLVFAPQVLARRDPAAATTCTGALGHATTNDLTVPAGAVCRLSFSTVKGTVTVGNDAYFEAVDTKITGAIRATGALTVFLHDGTSVGANVLVNGAAQLYLYRSTVDGTIRVVGAAAPGFGHVQVCDTTAGGIEIRASGPDLLVGDPAARCPGNHVKNDVLIVGNQPQSDLQVSGNVIAGSLVVRQNTGTAAKVVANNTVEGSMDLSYNSEPFTASNNGASAAG
jgi:hypothetical protein